MILRMRLKKLEKAGILEPRAYSDHLPRADYLLGDRSRALGPVLTNLKTRGEQHAIPANTTTLGED
jgi:DNA-binding HxlR family transcriptional regulator